MPRLLISLLVFISVASTTFAGWEGPKEIASFNYGEGREDIGTILGEHYDEVKILIDGDSCGNVLVGDKINKKVIIVNDEGLVKSIIRPNSELDKRLTWPSGLFALNRDSLIVPSRDRHQIFLYDGSLSNTLNINNSIITYAFNDYTLSVFTGDDERYKRYSSSGEFLGPIDNGEKFSVYPTLILGERKESGQYHYNFSFPNTTPIEFVLPSKSVFKVSQNQDCSLNFMRHKSDGLYVVRSHGNGEVMGEFKAPKSVFGGREDSPRIVSVYGELVFGKDGNAYAYKRTPAKLSIVKWTWVDGPDDPKSDCSK